MFKKPKKNKLEPPPAAPSFNEILSDVDTFQINNPLSIRPKVEATSPQSLDAWWKEFEGFVKDHKDLYLLNKQINSRQLKLESQKVELEMEGKLLQDEIENQQQVIKALLD